MTATRTTSKPAKSRRKTAGTVWDNVKQILVAVVLALLIKTSVVEAYKIPTASMEDTLLIGDFLLANKFLYGAQLPFVDVRLPAVREPERGDIIIFVYPVDGQTKYIKRCIGLPGDTIEMKDKELFVNGERFPDSDFAKYIDTAISGQPRVQPRNAGGRGSRDNFGPYVVPPDSYFMMGDNRDNSSDSRYWGCVPRSMILGRAMVIHWSWDDSRYPSPEVSPANPLSVPRMFLYNIVHFPQKVRWSRLFNSAE
jgi:signal peptidase I